MKLKKNKAIFLDRDGTINIDKEYMFKSEDFEFEPKAIEALKTFSNLGYILIVVTNQSGIGRGYYTENDLEILHKHMNSLLEKHNIQITKYYYCPHHKSHGIGEYKIDCQCRKPHPYMILKGIEEFNIDPSLSFMVGDKISDIEAGLAANVKPILLKTRKDINFDLVSKDVDVFNTLYDFSISL